MMKHLEFLPPRLHDASPRHRRCGFFPLLWLLLIASPSAATPVRPPHAFVHRAGRPSEPEPSCRVHLTESRVPRLQPLDVTPSPAAATLPLLQACPFLAPWPDHRMLGVLVRRSTSGLPRSTLAIQGLDCFYDVTHAGPSLFSLFSWQRQPTVSEAARLTRHVIAALDGHYVARRRLPHLVRALATEAPTSERFPLQIEVLPLRVLPRGAETWTIRTDAVVYTPAAAGLFHYRCEFTEGAGAIDVTRLVTAAAQEVRAFRSIVENQLGL